MSSKTSLVVAEHSQMTYEVKEHVSVARTLQGFAVTFYVGTLVSWKEKDERLFGTVDVLHADVSVLLKRTGWLHAGRAVPELPELAAIAMNDGVSGDVMMRLDLSAAAFERFDLERGGDDLEVQFRFTFVVSTYLRFGERLLVAKAPRTKYEGQLQRAYASSTWSKVADAAGVHTRFILETPAIVPDSDSRLRPAYEVFRSAQISARNGLFRECRVKCRDALRLVADGLEDGDDIVGYARDPGSLGHRSRKGQRLQLVRAALSVYSDSDGPRPDGDFDQDDALGLLLMVGGIMRTIGKLPPTS